jgi:nicotinamidase-related amidase
MPLTTLDNTAALIVIDLQKGLAGMPGVHPLEGIIDRSAQLARAFRARGLPVVLVTVSGGAPGRTDAKRPPMTLPADFAEPVPELGRDPSDILITKQRVGAFIGTTLNETLRERGVTQVFLTGVATSQGIEATARSASDHGYHVVLVTDAMTDRDADAHRHSIERIFPRIGETDTTAEVLKMLK